MKFNLHLTVGREEREARARVGAVGSAPEGSAQMAPKMRHYCLKLNDVPAETALLLKKELLGLGGEAAVSAEVYYKKAGMTDVIMMGTVSQFRALATKLTTAPGGGAELARDIPIFLQQIERRHFEIHTPKGKLVLGRRPVLMGIINCTPDSFYDGGQYKGVEAAVARGKELVVAGAEILDVGGESTRPGAEPVPVEEELRRVVPVIERLAQETSALISVDTQKAEVARQALAAGAAIINDVAALADPAMARTAAESGAGLILMHMQGEPRTMQQNPTYQDLFAEIISYLRERIGRAKAAGVNEEKIIIDPGIGFGKMAAHNLELIRDLWRLRSLGRPILLGPSNKSFIGRVLGVEVTERTEGTAAAVVAGILAGAHIVRVHDVAGMKRYVEMASAIQLGEKWQE